MRALISKQIENYKDQITLMNFVFSLLNIFSLVLMALIFDKILAVESANSDVFVKYIQAFAALFVPYLTFVAKGYIFPFWRKLDTLFHLYFNDTYTEEESKIIYDKD